MEKHLVADVMKKASLAIQLDTENKLNEAYHSYLSCLLSVVQGLIQSIQSDAVPVTKTVKQAVRIGQQCMDRVAMILETLGASHHTSGEQILTDTHATSDNDENLTSNQSIDSSVLSVEQQYTDKPDASDQEEHKHGTYNQETQHIPFYMSIDEQASHKLDEPILPTKHDSQEDNVEIHDTENTSIDNEDVWYIPPLPGDPDSLPRNSAIKRRKSFIEEAKLRNQRLMALHQTRLATLSPAAAAELNLTLQRKMAENLAIARDREQVIIKRIRERQNRLEEEATRRYMAVFGESQEDHEYRDVYQKVLEYEQDQQWLLSWRHKLRSNPKEPTIIRDLISEILKCSDHPLTQLLKSYQYKVYERIYPLVARNLKELDNISVPLNDVYWLSALDVCARSISSRNVDQENVEENEITGVCENLIKADDIKGKKKDTKKTDDKKCSAENLDRKKSIDEILNSSENGDKTFSLDSNSEKLETSKSNGATNTGNNQLYPTNAKNSVTIKLKGISECNITDVKFSGDDSIVSETVDVKNDAMLDRQQLVCEDINENICGAESLNGDRQKKISSNVYNTENKLCLEFLKNKQHDERMVKDIRKTTEEIYDEIMSGGSLPDFLINSSIDQSQNTDQSQWAIQFDNVTDDDFIKMTNDAYDIHLDTLKQDVHRYMEKLLVIFVVSFEALDSPEGRDLCYAYLEVPFFSSLWKYIIALFRLCNLPKELCMAVAMSEFKDVTPEKMYVKDTFCLTSDPQPYLASIQQLHTLTKWSTPLSKLECLVGVIQSVLQCIDDYYAQDTVLEDKPNAGADELLPIITYILIRSGLPQIVSECHALDQLVHEGYLMGEEGYCLTSLQTAANYIISLGEDILLKRMTPDLMSV